MSYKEEFKERLLPQIKVLDKIDDRNNGYEIVDTNTGESKGIVGRFYKKSFVDNESFVKIFKNYIKLSQITENMSKMSIRLLLWCMENVPKNKNEIELNAKYLGEYFNIKSLSKIYESIRQLEKLDLIRKTNKIHVYEINPSVIFNGNRIEFISKIVSEKTSRDGWKIVEYREIKAKKI